MVTGASVSRLFLFPIKSCAGVEVAEFAVGPLGPVGDRRWMLVDRNGTFLSQRTLPAMALVRTALANGVLTLEAPGMAPLSLPFDANGSEERLEVTIWNDSVTASPQGPEADAWFSDALGVRCRLVGIAAGHSRKSVSFPDSAPFLITSTASLDDLNGRLPSPVPMDRFRPNVVVTGLTPYTEDSWREIRIGAIRFPALYACDRCSITTVDQRTAHRGTEPLRTLAGYRRRGRGVPFGMRAIHANTGTLQVGDPVTQGSERSP